MRMEGPSAYQQCQELDTGVLSSIRHHLKKNNFYNFDSLLDALQSQDKAGVPPSPLPLSISALYSPPPPPPPPIHSFLQLSLSLSALTWPSYETLSIHTIQNYADQLFSSTV